MSKVLIILSGGMDSVTLLYDILVGYNPDEVLALSFNYGSKHNARELQKAIHNCAKLNVEHKIIDLHNIFKEFNSNLLEGKGTIPKGHYEQENMVQTVVPFRNGILLSIAVGIAESNKIQHIVYGAHAGDHAIYPDCRDEFINAINEAAKTGTYNNVEIVAPFHDLTKIEIIKKGIELGVDYKETWTCYEGQNEPCGKCGSCVERTEGFIKNNTKDPLYSDESWELAVKYYNEANDKRVL